MKLLPLIKTIHKEPCLLIYKALHIDSSQRKERSQKTMSLISWLFLQARIQIKRRRFPLEFHERSQQSLEHLTMNSWNIWSEWINDLSGLPHVFYNSIPLQILIVLRKKVSDKAEVGSVGDKSFGSNCSFNYSNYKYSNRHVQEHKTDHLRMKDVCIISTDIHKPQ